VLSMMIRGHLTYYAGLFLNLRHPVARRFSYDPDRVTSAGEFECSRLCYR